MNGSTGLCLAGNDSSAAEFDIVGMGTKDEEGRLVGIHGVSGKQFKLSGEFVRSARNFRVGLIETFDGVSFDEGNFGSIGLV